MKIALLGSTGMLGSMVLEVFRSKGHEVLAPGRAEVDLERPHTLERLFKTRNFDVLVNCAAFTRVDASEEPAKFSMALNVNGAAVGWLAKFCREKGKILVHFSTDYVFNGRKEEPYLETDPPDPLNTYGRTKWQGEKLLLVENPFHYLVRTSWVFGPGGRNFVDTMIGLLGSKPRIEVVEDQVGSPTYTPDLAGFALELLEKKAEPGFYHFSNEGSCSWFDFAREIRRQTGLLECEIAGVSGESIFRPAARPANSRLDLSKSFLAVGHPFRPWKEALADYLAKGYSRAKA
jgi:dTDP-4-dehydrorhamnose reductase